MDEEQTWPQILGLFKSVVVALTYMRRDRVQAELAETYEGIHSGDRREFDRGVQAVVGGIQGGCR